MNVQIINGRTGLPDHLLFTTSFTYNNVYYKAALAETISWDGLHAGTYDVLLQSSRGTHRLTLVQHGNRWQTGGEVEQIGLAEQAVVDLLGDAIGQVREQYAI